MEKGLDLKFYNIIGGLSLEYKVTSIKVTVLEVNISRRFGHRTKKNFKKIDANTSDSNDSNKNNSNNNNYYYLYNICIILFV